MKIPFKKKQLFFHVLISFILVIIWIFGFKNLNPGTEIVIRGTIYTLTGTFSLILRLFLLFSGLFFVLIGYFSLKSLLSNKPGLILDKKGIYYNHPLWRQKIPWVSISGFNYNKIGKDFSRKIFFSLKTNSSKRFFWTFLGNKNRLFIDVNSLKCDPKDLIGELKKFCEEKQNY